jgi:hypothetical protein
MRPFLLASLLLLAACGSEPENVQARSENMSRLLETRANELEAEAGNDVAAQVEPLDHEADGLLNQMNAAEPAANEAANGA